MAQPDRDRPARPFSKVLTDPHTTDPPLLSENSHFRTYTTTRFTYPDLRVFYRPHAKAEELPTSPGPLPLLVFLHGLGGSVAQFHPLLNSLVDLAPCLAIDLPGCGRSKFALSNWDAYTPEALCELLELVIEDWRDKDRDQTVVLLGHSMGSAFAAKLANKKMAKKEDALAASVVGLVGICPPAEPLDENTTWWARMLIRVPEWIFMAWRLWDGIGGPDSPSVARFVGENPEPELKRMQYRFNQQSRSGVWRRMTWGLLATFSEGKASGGLPGLEYWADLDIPVYLIGGEDDHLTPPKKLHKVMDVLSAREPSPNYEANGADDEDATDVAHSQQSDFTPNVIEDGPAADSQYLIIDSSQPSTKDSENGPNTPTDGPISIPPQPRHPPLVNKSFLIPSSTHAVLYQPRAVRVIAGLISDFLTAHVTGRLSLAWQLQYLCREGKWDVKNLTKWKAVVPVSDPIPAPGSAPRHGIKQRPIFRALKTLRESDDVHSPDGFVSQWGCIVKDVIDISKDQPVYDPHTLHRSQIHYHKFPTVSKIPPTGPEVEAFIALVDSILEHRETNQGKAEGETEGEEEEQEECVIGVHCHYGYNRTGYFIVCYLVERCGFEVKEAIEEFRKAKPNGIRHSHFLDQLSVRYMNWDWETMGHERRRGL